MPEIPDELDAVFYSCQWEFAEDAYGKKTVLSQLCPNASITKYNFQGIIQTWGIWGLSYWNSAMVHHIHDLALSISLNQILQGLRKKQSQCHVISWNSRWVIFRGIGLCHHIQPSHSYSLMSYTWLKWYCKTECDCNRDKALISPVM